MNDNYVTLGAAEHGWPHIQTFTDHIIQAHHDYHVLDSFGGPLPMSYLEAALGDTVHVCGGTSQPQTAQEAPVELSV